MKLRTKKGLMASTLTKLILFLVIALILIVFVGKVALFGKERSDVEVCRLSVLAASKMKWEEVKSTLGLQLKCPTHKVEIKSTDENKIKKEIADEMYSCWYKMGEGKVNPFPKGAVQLVGNKFCVICSEIEFSEKTQERVKKVSDFMQFLADTNIPNSNMSYYSYINGGVRVQGSVSEELKKTNIVDEIDTSKTYYIIYTVLQKDLWKKMITSISAFSAGAGAGYLVAVGIASVVPGGQLVAASIIGAGVIIGGTTGTIAGYSFGTKYEDTVYAISLIPQNIPLGEGGMNCTHLIQ